MLQAALVDRTKLRVALTPLGLETVGRARKILEGLEELAGAARAQREPLSGTVRMGVISTVGPCRPCAVLRDSCRSLRRRRYEGPLMHEMALCRGVVQILEEQAKAHATAA